MRWYDLWCYCGHVWGRGPSDVLCTSLQMFLMFLQCTPHHISTITFEPVNYATLFWIKIINSVVIPSVTKAIRSALPFQPCGYSSYCKARTSTYHIKWPFHSATMAITPAITYLVITSANNKRLFTSTTIKNYSSSGNNISHNDKYHQPFTLSNCYNLVQLKKSHKNYLVHWKWQ